MNDMEISQVLSQMRQVAQSGALPQAGPAAAPAQPFATVLKNSLDKVNQLHTRAGNLGKQFELGNSETSLPQVMVALEKASVSFEAVKQVRNRLVAAYQEIMNMQI